MHRKRIAFIMAIAFALVMVLDTSAVSASYDVLQKESESNEVKALQRDLIKLGYLSSDATGYYGDLTEKAVRELQDDYGYEADGIAGEETLKLLDRLMGRLKSSVDPSKLMQEGDENEYVAALQKNLIKLGYLDTKATGFYGPATKRAVLGLQEDNGIEADGIAGAATLSLISELISGGTDVAGATATAGASGSDEEVTDTDASGTDAQIQTDSDDTGTDGKVIEKKKEEDYLLKWYGNVEKILARGDTATVYDILTGKSFKIKRTYGTNHADCETLTKADTAIMKKIYSGVWSWERRAIIVKVDGYEIAACMTGYPHAGKDSYAANKTIASRSGGYKRGTNLDAVKNNSMDGVFDIHFLNSRNHYNNKVDPKHQAKIKEAAKWAVENQG